MLIQIWVRDDESGLLDGESRDGDIQSTKLDTDSVGGQEKKSFLFVKVADPPNMQAFRDELITPEYLPAASAGTDPQVKHKTKYRVDWRTKFSESEIATVSNATQVLPDGSTSAGGNVVNGIVEDLFVIGDIIRK